MKHLYGLLNSTQLNSTHSTQMQTNSILVVYTAHTLTGILLTSILGLNWWRPLDCFSATFACLYITNESFEWFLLSHNGAVHVSMAWKCRTSSSIFILLVEFLSVASRFAFIYSILSGLIIRFGRDEFSSFSTLFRECKIDSALWQWSVFDTFQISNVSVVSTAFETMWIWWNSSIIVQVHKSSPKWHFFEFIMCKIHWT